MNYPAELQYSKSHEWVKMEDGVTVIGISDFAQDALGDVVFVNLPGEGDDVTAGEAFGDVESVKAVSDLVQPGHRRGVRRQRGAAGRSGAAEQRSLRRLDHQGGERGRPGGAAGRRRLRGLLRRRRAEQWEATYPLPRRSGRKCWRPSGWRTIRDLYRDVPEQHAPGPILWISPPA